MVQRKVLWALRQMRVTSKPDKVSSLTGKVMSSMAYAHGEASLAAAISFMARTFVAHGTVNEFKVEGGGGGSGSSERK